jgi:hypothetical protein
LHSKKRNLIFARATPTGALFVKGIVYLRPAVCGREETGWCDELGCDGWRFWWFACSA